jgi:hypothetical protein
MTPREFLDEVVRPNVAEFNLHSGSLRAAYNAVAAVDALAAHIFWSDAEVKKDKDDDRYRDRLAKMDENFRLLRDIAKAQKHVHLIYLLKSEPLIERVEQVTARHLGGAGELRAGGRIGDAPQVVVDIEKGGIFCVWNAVDEALAFLLEKMCKLGI